MQSKGDVRRKQAPSTNLFSVPEGSSLPAGETLRVLQADVDRPEIRVEIGSLPLRNEIALAPSNSEGHTGALNLAVTRAFGERAGLVKQGDLSGGHAVLPTRSGSRVAFVVTVGTGDTAGLLEKNLGQALDALQKPAEGRGLWIPLMGTGFGTLSFEDSLRITARVLRDRLDQGVIRPSRIRISLPPEVTPERAEAMADELQAILGGAPRSAAGLESFANWVLSDSPVTDAGADLLDFDAYARALFDLVNNPKTVTPLVLSIDAPWGAGKSSLGRLLQRRFEQTRSARGIHPYVTCWFNAWQHDDAENLSTALCTHVARRADDERSTWNKLIHPLPTEFLSSRRRIWRRVGYLVGLVLLCALFTWLAGIWNLLEPLAELAGEDVWPFLELLGPAGSALLAGVALWRFVGSWTAPLLGFVRDPEDTARSGSMEEVRAKLGKLIRQGTPPGSKFVLFVDDIERCRPPRSVDLLETINQLLMHEDVVVVLMGDMRTVAANVEIKYAELAQIHGAGAEVDSSLSRETWGKRYLQKIVQLEFELPGLSATEIQNLVAGFSEGAAPPMDPPDPGSEDRSRTRLEFWNGRLERFLRKTPTLLLLILLAGSLVRIFDERFQGLEVDLGQVLLFGFFGAVGLVAFLVVALTRIRERLDARLTQQRKRARDILRQEEDGQAFLASDREQVSAEILDEQEALHLSNDSALVAEAFRIVLDHVPVLPRNAKRLLNRLRLQILLALRRGLLDASPASNHDGLESARIIAKWVALGEAWPEIARAARERPELLGELESAEFFEERLETIAPGLSDDPAVAQFFAAQPRFGHTIVELIRLRPAETAA